MPIQAAHFGFEFLVFGVIGAQRITVTEQYHLPKPFDRRRAIEKPATAFAEQAQSVFYLVGEGVVIVVADPCLEHIAQQVQFIRIEGRLFQKPKKTFADIRPAGLEMDIGCEDNRH